MHARSTALATLFLACLAPGACSTRELAEVEIRQSGEQQVRIPVRIEPKIDLLFVIDDSGSMREEQGSLGRNFEAFIRVLETIEGGLPSLHIGVVSSNVGTGPDGGGGAACAGNGDNGRLQLPDGCPPLADGARFLRDVVVDRETGARERNYDGALAEQFACMAQLGVEGCGFEQHLEAMRRALTGPDSDGFLRDEAYLAVVFVQDEDDCSARDRTLFDPTQDSRDAPLGELSSYRCFEFGAVCDSPADERATGPRTGCRADEAPPYLEPVGAYVEFLKQLKGDPRKVVVAAITAGAEPVAVGIDPVRDELRLEPACRVCPGGGPDCPAEEALVAAAPALRMHAFLAGFPQRSTHQPICSYDPAADDVDLSGALTQLGLLVGKTFPLHWCVDGRLAEPHDCVVSDVTGLGTDAAVETLLPACDGAASVRPCWRLVPSDACPTETGLELEVVRDEDPPPGTTVVARCLVD